MNVNDGIHPLKVCADCGRIVFRRNWDGPIPEGAVRFFARGRCQPCYNRAHEDDRAAVAAERLHANHAGLAHYMAARESRIRRRQRAALTRALSAGWQAAM